MHLNYISVFKMCSFIALHRRRLFECRSMSSEQSLPPRYPPSSPSCTLSPSKSGIARTHSSRASFTNLFGFSAYHRCLFLQHRPHLQYPILLASSAVESCSCLGQRRRCGGWDSMEFCIRLWNSHAVSANRSLQCSSTHAAISLQLWASGSYSAQIFS